MITLQTLRLAGIVLAAVAGLGLVYVVFDAIGDAREAKVWGKINAAIDETNEETDAANVDDAEERAVRQKLRVAALAAAAKVKGSQCLLTKEEALAIGAIR